MVISKSVKATLKKHMLVDGKDLILDLDKSHDSWIVDKRTGEEYLDLYSMYASQCVGYNHPSMLQIKDQLGRVALLKPTNSEIYTEEMAEFVDTFSRVGIPSYLPYAFFIEGGALAVENALKVAFDWKVRKNIAKGVSKDKGRQVIHFKDAFHGRSGYTLSLTNTANPDKTKYFPKFNWPRIDNPKVNFPLTDQALKEIKESEAKAICQIKDALAENQDDIAALIIEPIQSEGGDFHFRKEFMQALRQLCWENEILFILDEVQTGVGITGKFWAHEHDEIEPDIISFGKKSQVCGILTGKRVDEIKENVFHTSSRIASTWGGNLLDMVRFTQILRIIEQDKLLANAAQQGAFLLEKLQNMADTFPDILNNPRGKGLLCAVDFASESARDNFLKLASDERLLIIGCGHTSIRFRPNLTISRSELNYGLDIMQKLIPKVY